MTKINLLGALGALSMFLLLQAPAWSAEPTVHEIYAVAASGRVHEAQQMMQQVLRNHPNSGQAHFVNSELLARENQLAAARAELATAERLSPGLPFANPQSVQALRARLASSNLAARSGPSASGIPWGLLLLGGAVIFAIVAIIRAITRRNSMPATTMANPGQPMYGPGYGPGQGPMMGGGGMGGGIMGGLATGAAVGAGLVAGEALAHRLVDEPGSHEHNAPVPDQQNDGDNNDSLGGQDFGLTDNSSWDSGGGDFGGDGGGDWS